MSRSILHTFGLALLLLVPSSCKGLYYSTMERFGTHKRDILVDRVEEARSSQEKAQEEFVSTLELFKQLTDFEGGELEELYDRLESRYERCEGRAEDVEDRVESIRSVSKDMFREWEEEIERDIADPDLARRSRELMAESQERYDTMIAKMERASSKMEPVLTAFRGRVTFIKHNLNARALTSLKDTVLEIEDDVTSLIQDIQVSIDEANAFIASMES